MPRLARGRYDEVRFLRVPPSHVGVYLDRLAESGAVDVLLVSVDPERSLDELPASYAPVGPVEPYALQYEDVGGLIRLRRRP